MDSYNRGQSDRWRSLLDFKGPGTSPASSIVPTLLLVIFVAAFLQHYFDIPTMRPFLGIASFLWHTALTLVPPSMRHILVSLKNTAKLPFFGDHVYNPLPSVGKLLLGKTVDDDTPPGLGNFDNSCYQNSILQCLSSLPSVRDYFSRMTAEFGSLGPESITATLDGLLKDLNHDESNGKTLWTPQKLKTMDSINPQDAHEYFGSMMEYTEKELIRVIRDRPVSEGLRDIKDSSKNSEDMLSVLTKKFASPEDVERYRNPFDGWLADRTVCTKCGHSEGLRLISFNTLLMQFPKGFPQWYTFKLDDLIREYSKLEIVGPTYCAKCTLLQTQKSLEQLLNASATNSLPTSDEFQKTANARLETVNNLIDSGDFGEDDKKLITECGIPKKRWAETMKSKQSVIARAPHALALHINRSEFDETTWQVRKNSSHVNFSFEQDMSPWVLGGRNTPIDPKSPENMQYWKMEATQSLLPDNSEGLPDSGGELQYELRAVVRHQGFGHNNGHYICYKKRDLPEPKSGPDVQHQSKTGNFPTSEWWSLSDEDVRLQDERSVQQAPGVFMLFYERRALDPQAADSYLGALPEGEQESLLENAESKPEDLSATDKSIAHPPPGLPARTPEASSVKTMSTPEDISPLAQNNMSSDSHPPNPIQPPNDHAKPHSNTAEHSQKLSTDTVPLHLLKQINSEPTQQSRPVQMRTAGTPKKRRKNKSLQMVATT